MQKGVFARTLSKLRNAPIKEIRTNVLFLAALATRLLMLTVIVAKVIFATVNNLTVFKLGIYAHSFVIKIYIQNHICNFVVRFNICICMF